MHSERDPIDEIEHKLDIKEAAAAAGSLAAMTEAEARAIKASQDASNATTAEDRLRAQIDEDRAALDQIHAMSADSRAEWELHRMADEA